MYEEKGIIKRPDGTYEVGTFKEFLSEFCSDEVPTSKGVEPRYPLRMKDGFEVYNRTSGVYLGFYEGDTEAGSLLQMYEDAGYHAYADENNDKAVVYMDADTPVRVKVEEFEFKESERYDLLKWRGNKFVTLMEDLTEEDAELEQLEAFHNHFVKEGASGDAMFYDLDNNQDAWSYIEDVKHDGGIDWELVSKLNLSPTRKHWLFNEEVSAMHEERIE